MASRFKDYNLPTLFSSITKVFHDIDLERLLSGFNFERVQIDFGNERWNFHLGVEIQLIYASIRTHLRERFSVIDLYVALMNFLLSRGLKLLLTLLHR